MSDSDLLSAVQSVTEGPSVEDVITTELRKLIVEGRISEDAKLVHRQLASRFGVSPTPIRGALLRLAAEGFITFERNGHGTVASLTREDLEEIAAARTGVEGLAARLGANAIDDDGTAAMGKILKEMRGCAERGDRTTYLRLRWDLHAECYRSARRARLLATVERLYWRAERYNHLLLADDERFSQSLAHYQHLLDACKARDGAAAETTIRNSIQWAIDTLTPALPSESD